ncbi:MAG: hypothetical protein HY707_01185 [Ignavibacteriae bacterium]|nr:hypothetical protein [Ignavibacteriota bacterium]
MNNYLMYRLIAVLLVLNLKDVYAQLDPSTFEDTSEVEKQFEQLLEQSTQAEDSPIFDVLFGDIRRSTIELRSRIIQDLQRSEGYDNGAYIGSRMKSYQRTKFSYGEHLSGGVLFEKDAGEQRMNDFASGNVMVSNVDALSKVVVGDYLIEAGQGVTLWRGFDVAKGADIVSPVRKAARGLIPYSSSDEHSFLRGIAVEVDFWNVTTQLFYSRRSLSASINDNGTITTLYTAGYFRTETEEAKRGNVSERLFGGRGIYHLSEMNSVGLTFYQTEFSKTLFLDNGKRFNGNRFSMLSTDYHVEYKTTQFFGEWAKVNGVVGGVSGIVMKPSTEVQLIAAYRRYPFEFISLHGLGFGEQLSTSNESGLYLGLRLKLLRSVTFSSYYDQFKFPEPRSNVNFSSKGHDVFSQLEIRPMRRLDVTCRYQHKVAEAGTIIENSNGFEVRVNDAQRRQLVRLNLDYRLTKELRIRGRIERVFFTVSISDRSEKGTMFYHDILFNTMMKLWLNFRVAFFETDSYDARMYEYENDLRGVLSLPALYGRGVRWYLLIRFKLADKIELSAKYSDLLRDDVKRIGSGLDQLPGSHDNRIGVQVDFRF